MPHVPGVHYIKYTMADNHRFFARKRANNSQQFWCCLDRVTVLLEKLCCHYAACFWGPRYLNQVLVAPSIDSGVQSGASFQLSISATILATPSSHCVGGTTHWHRSFPHRIVRRHHERPPPARPRPQACWRRRHRRKHWRHGCICPSTCQHHCNSTARRVHRASHQPFRQDRHPLYRSIICRHHAHCRWATPT